MTEIDLQAFRKCLLSGVDQNGSVHIDARIFESHFGGEAEVNEWLESNGLEWSPIVKLSKKGG